MKKFCAVLFFLVGWVAIAMAGAETPVPDFYLQAVFSGGMAGVAGLCLFVARRLTRQN